ncbi:MAG: MazG nucleotide pyrophosphohydrolase domain-containing protein [Alphaproteobacteria bacterium]|nr:MazG nucleotide pyrophosphohydrolase domain-containing protein [Alphaproteobacteria bacterium]MDN5248926.1 MazG nucleotide pyrophosphohydrolase domain-containing protein [Alphaproteobacteria bacterium]
MSETKIEDLINIINKLRDPVSGCPWAQQQSYESLTTYIIEEAMESVEAIVERKEDELCAELGDLLFQIAFCAVIATEKQSFTFADIVDAIVSKLQRRNPHIFQPGNIQAYSQAENKLAFVTKQWQEIKALENPTPKLAKEENLPVALAIAADKFKELQLQSKAECKKSKAYSELLDAVLQIGRILNRT